MDKQALANKIRAQRVNYSVVERLPWDKMIHDIVMDIADTHKSVGIYAAFKGEVDTYGIIESLLWDKDKIIALPRIESGKMNFYRIDSLTDLVSGHFGVLEPIGNERVEPGLMLVPLSAFNHSLHRIGYGKGYYDTYFTNHHCLKVGLAYSFQKVEVEFQNDHDVALDAIVTEREIFYDQTL